MPRFSLAPWFQAGLIPPEPEPSELPLRLDRNGYRFPVGIIQRGSNGNVKLAKWGRPPMRFFFCFLEFFFCCSSDIEVELNILEKVFEAHGVRGEERY